MSTLRPSPLTGSQRRPDHGLHEAGHAMGLEHAEGDANNIDVSVMATDWLDRDEYPDRLLPYDAGMLRAIYRRSE
jgi:hypothetical protein